MQQLHVVIVDDEPDVSALIKRRLAKDAPHFDIATLDSARDCLSYLKKRKADCVLTDYQMPGMDGMELLASLRRGGDDTPVIFVTGQGNEEVAREAFKNGAFDYFTKEIGFAHFMRIVNSVEQAAAKRRAVRKKEMAEAAHNESERFLSSIFTSIRDGINIIDSEYNILKVNPVIEKWFAHALPLVGRKCYEVFHCSTEPADGCPGRQTMETGRPASEMVPLCGPDGVEAGLVEMSSFAFVDEPTGQIRGVIEYSRPVIAAGTDTAMSRRALEAIVNAIDFGMIIVGRDRRVRHANRTALDMMGIDDEADIVGQPCHQNICPAEVGRCPILDLGQKVDLSEKLLLTREGGDVPILKTVTPIEIEGEELLLETFVDIRSQKAAQKEAADTRAYLQSIIDGAADPIMVIGKDYTVGLMNEAARRLSRSPDAVAGTVKCHQLSHGVDAPCAYEEGHECPLDHVLGTGEPITVIHRHVGPDGGDVWVEITASPLRDTHGEITSVIESSRDVTDRVSMERQRADLYAMLSHDLRGPLTTILGYSEIMLDSKEALLDSEATDMLSAIRGSSKKLASMVEGFLAFSRLESGQHLLALTPTDPEELLNAASSEYTEQAAKKGISFETRLEPGLSPVKLDWSYALRAVSNLLENALNYTPDGGRITLGARKAEGGGIVVYVSDTGPGIPEQERDKVFDRYYRSPSVTGVRGSGLGLAIVKAVMEAHGGSVELSSEVGSGSTFSLLFPHRD